MKEPLYLTSGEAEYDDWCGLHRMTGSDPDASDRIERKGIGDGSC